MNEKTFTGACRFCGQTKLVTLTEDEWLERIMEKDKDPEDIANDMATEECTCREGSDWRADKLVISRCRENIEAMFREEYAEIADILQEAVPMVYSQEVKRISVVTPESGLATLVRSGGNLKIKFTQKHETELTASF